MEEIKNLDLGEGEEVLYHTKPIHDNKLIKKLQIGGVFFTLIGVGIFIWNLPAYFTVLLYVLLQFSLNSILLIVGVTLLYMAFDIQRTNFYITSRNVIKLLKRGGIKRKPKIFMISLDNIAHIHIYFSELEIIPKGINGEVYYDGTEMDHLPNPKKTKTIRIGLDGDEGDRVKEELKELLIELVPMSVHPKIKYVFLTTRIPINGMSKRKIIKVKNGSIWKQIAYAQLIFSVFIILVVIFVLIQVFY